MIKFLLLINVVEAHTYEWESLPDVEVCDKIVDKTEVIESVSYWQKKIGAKISTIKFDVNCEIEKSNAIQIYSNKEKTESFGETVIDYYYFGNNSERRYINNATIKLSDHMIRKDNITLRHELGHAFGLLHEDHGIMKPYY